MVYQGIIFDFNGVLLWDSQLQEQAWREFAREQFGISLTDEIMATEVNGRNNKHTLEFLAGTPLEDKRVEQLSNQKEVLYRALCLVQGDEFELSPGAIYRTTVFISFKKGSQLLLLPGGIISYSSSSTCSLSAGLIHN